MRDASGEWRLVGPLLAHCLMPSQLSQAVVPTPYTHHLPSATRQPAGSLPHRDLHMHAEM